jgi:hypothetical protein
VKISYFLVIGLAAALASCAPQQEQVAAPAAAAVAPAGPPETFTYTEAPTLALIPIGPIQGEANGKPFEAKTIIFEPKSDGSWTAKFCEADLEDPTEVLIEGQSIYFELPENPESGKVISKPMEFGGGYFQIFQPGGTGDTTSWNADNAWVLEITEWNQQPWNPDGDFFQTAGTVSGRVAICYKGYGDFRNSWAAGNFDDAVIRYMGEPPWVATDE